MSQLKLYSATPAGPAGSAGRSARLSRRLDRLYLKKPGLLLDLKLIATTVAVSIVGKRRVRRWLSRGRTI